MDKTLKINPDTPCCQTCLWWQKVDSITCRNHGECVFPESRIPVSYLDTTPPLMEGHMGTDCGCWEDKASANN